METVAQLLEDEQTLHALADVEVLYTDLDGTLLAKGGCVLANSEGDPSCLTAEAIVEANRAGLTIVPVSGRSRMQLIELVRLLGWTDFIAEAGAVLVHGVGAGQRVIYNNGEWPDSVLASGTDPYDIIRRTGAIEALVESFPGRIEYHDPWHEGREATHLLRGNLDVAAAQAVLDRLEPPIDIVDNGLVRNPGTLELTEDELPHAYHLVPAGVSKAQALRFDLETRGLRPDQAAGIGDSAADLGMADGVGTLVLVANAFESPSVLSALETTHHPRIRRTKGARGEGWTEFVRAWIAARG